MHEYEFGLGFMKCKGRGWFVYWNTRGHGKFGELLWQHSRPLFRVWWFR